MAILPSVVKKFINLAKIPSPSGKEETIKNYIIDNIKNISNDIYLDKIGNLYFKIPGKIKKTLLLSAHMDTVNPTGYQVPIIKNNIIYSNGNYILGADNKAAIAVILSVLEKINKDIKIFPNLEILFTVREETEGGIRQFDRNKIKSKHALTMDTSVPVGSVIISSAYVGGYSINIKTKGCHVAKTVKKTVHPLSFLKNFIKKIPFGRINENTIINISKIRMGENYNNVPENLYFAGEIRTFNEKTYKNFFKKIKNIVVENDIKIKTTSKISFFHYCQGYNLKEKDLRLIKKIVKKLKIKYSPVKTFSVGDFNVLNEWNIKTINLGNGADEVHTTRENISIDSILDLEKIVIEYIKSF